MSTDYILNVRSAAMFATWVHFPTDHLCFDMGDGLVSTLGHRLVGIQTVLLSHGHRDHIAGLPMFMNVRCNHEGPIRVVYPVDANMIADLRTFVARFERKATPDRVEWIAARPGEYIEQTKKNLFILPFETNHYRIDDRRVRSLGYHLCLRKKKVRDEFRGLTTQETHALILEKGPDAVLHEVEEKYLTYSGDTAVLDPTVYAGTRVLLHESTFLTTEDREGDDTAEARYHRHAALPEVMDLAAAAGVEHLGLYHFSSRYEYGQVMDAVRREVARRRPAFKVSVALPGKYTMDLLSKTIDPGAGAAVLVAVPAAEPMDGMDTMDAMDAADRADEADEADTVDREAPNTRM